MAGRKGIQAGCYTGEGHASSLICLLVRYISIHVVEAFIRANFHVMKSNSSCITLFASSLVLTTHLHVVVGQLCLGVQVNRDHLL